MTKTTSTKMSEQTLTQPEIVEKKKNSKKRKSPFRRGRTAYLLFHTKRRRTIKIEQPDLDFGNISGVMGVEWNNLTPEQKRPYEEESQARKAAAEVYNKNLRETQPDLIAEWNLYRKQKKSEKRVKSKSRPSQSKNCFMLFKNNVYPQVKLDNPGKLPKELFRIIGIMWHALSQEDKDVWHDKAKEQSIESKRVAAAAELQSESESL